MCKKQRSGPRHKVSRVQQLHVVVDVEAKVNVDSVHETHPQLAPTGSEIFQFSVSNTNKFLPFIKQKRLSRQ